jgi:hypothetical protein
LHQTLLTIMAAKTYYQLLQVDPLADPEVITAAYRRLAVKYHPDTNGSSANAKANMQALNEAYAVLSDPVERTAYDRRLAAASATAAQPRTSSPSSPGAAKAAAPQPKPPAPPMQATGTINARTIGIYVAIAGVLLALTVFGFGPIGPVEMLVVLGVSTLLVQPVSAWLSRRSRR